MKALGKINLTAMLGSTFMHRIEVTLPVGAMGLALDQLSGNVVTRVKPLSPSDMVGIVPQCYLQEVNGIDTTTMDYKETVKLLQKANDNISQPVRLTIKSTALLEAKPENLADEKIDGIVPETPLQQRIPAKNEFEVKLRHVTREDLTLIKSGSDFIIKSVKKDSVAFKKGIHVMDEIVGVNGCTVVGHQLLGVLDAIYGEGSAESKKVSLRLRHHGEKFPPIRNKCGAHEYDVTYEEFPFGLEFDSPPTNAAQGTLVTLVEEESFSQENDVKKGHDLIGIDGQNVWHQPWNIVKHVLSNAKYPIVLRFRKPHFPKLISGVTSKNGVSRYTLKQDPLGFDCTDTRRVLENGKVSFTSKVSHLKPGAEASALGMKEGDYIIGINAFDVMSSGHDAVMKCLVTSDRPMVLTMYRGLLDVYDGGADSLLKKEKKLKSDMEKNKYRKNVMLIFADGPLGLNMESEEEQYCTITSIQKKSQASVLGVKKDDRIVKVGEIDIEENEMAFDTVLEALQLSERPVKIVFSRLLEKNKTKEGRKQMKLEKNQAKEKLREKEKKEKKEKEEQEKQMEEKVKQMEKIEKEFIVEQGPLGKQREDALHREH
jgi:C-terminal processing protease CtpA/Prc